MRAENATTDPLAKTRRKRFGSLGWVLVLTSALMLGGCGYFRSPPAPEQAAGEAEPAGEAADAAATDAAPPAETAKAETAKEETAKEETAKAETAKAEPAKEETAKEETAKAETAKEETAKTETAKEEPAKTEIAKSETASPPATKAASDAEPKVALEPSAGEKAAEIPKPTRPAAGLEILSKVANAYKGSQGLSLTWTSNFYDAGSKENVPSQTRLYYAAPDRLALRRGNVQFVRNVNEVFWSRVWKVEKAEVTAQDNTLDLLRRRIAGTVMYDGPGRLILIFLFAKDYEAEILRSYNGLMVESETEFQGVKAKCLRIRNFVGRDERLLIHPETFRILAYQRVFNKEGWDPVRPDESAVSYDKIQENLNIPTDEQFRIQLEPQKWLIGYKPGVSKKIQLEPCSNIDHAFAVSLEDKVESKMEDKFAPKFELTLIGENGEIEKLPDSQLVGQVTVFCFWSKETPAKTLKALKTIDELINKVEASRKADEDAKIRFFCINTDTGDSGLSEATVSVMNFLELEDLQLMDNPLCRIGLDPGDKLSAAFEVAKPLRQPTFFLIDAKSKIRYVQKGITENDVQTFAETLKQLSAK